MISRLTLQNFKVFARQEVPLRPLTLLTGINGAGKSTVLQSLLLLRQSYLRGFLQPDGPRAGLLLNGDLVSLGTARDVLYVDASEDRIGLGLEAGGLSSTWEFDYDRDADVLRRAPAAAVDPAALERTPFTGPFQYLEAERIGPRASSPMSDYVVRQLRELGTRGEYTAHFLSEYGGEPVAEDALMHDGAASRRLRDQAEAWLGEVSPGARLNLSEHKDIDAVGMRFSYVVGAYESEAFRPASVGFGISYGLPVIVALLSAPRGATVLIENPEAHLHPRGQSRMGELAARAAAGGVQVLIESHSDHVLNGIRLAVRRGRIAPDEVALHYFRRGAGAPAGEPGADEDTGRSRPGIASEIVSPVIDAEGKLDKWPEGFFDEFDRSLRDLVRPRSWRS